MRNCLYVGLGGFIGAVLRYLFSFLPFAAGFPWATLLVNALGGLAIGSFSQITEHYSGLNPAVILFIQTGLCGGFTTFSTFSLETFRLAENQRFFMMAVYICASVILCLGAVWFSRSCLKLLLR